MKLVIKGDEKSLKAIMKRSRIMNVEMELLDCSQTCLSSKKEAKKIEEIEVVAEEVVEPKQEKPRRKRKTSSNKAKK